MKKEQTITKETGTAMRGVAILSIMLHNFTHWLGPMVKENEYTFSEHNVRRLMVEISHPSQDLLAHLLSFFGHYGVPVFVFLSAYGLTRKYESSEKYRNDRAWSLIKSHYIKLILMLLVGFSAFILVDYITPMHYHYEFWNVVGTIGMFANLYPEPDQCIWPGPYWYFGLMVQLYIIYRLVFFRGRHSLAGMLSKKQGNCMLVVLFLITLLGQLCFETHARALEYYRYNFMGSLPVFIMGIAYARNEPSWQFSQLTYALVSLCSCLLILAGSLYFSTWIIVPFLVVIATAAFIKALPANVESWFHWLGSISAAMFVCHPITRKILIPISRHGDIYTGLLVYVVASVMMSILFMHMINALQKKKNANN